MGWGWGACVSGCPPDPRYGSSQVGPRKPVLHLPAWLLPCLALMRLCAGCDDRGGLGAHEPGPLSGGGAGEGSAAVCVVAMMKLVA